MKKKSIKNRREEITDEVIELTCKTEDFDSIGYMFMTTFFAGADAMLEACVDKDADCAEIVAKHFKKTRDRLLAEIDEKLGK